MLEHSGSSGASAIWLHASVAKVCVDKPDAPAVIARSLGDCLHEVGWDASKELVIVCIGTDRSTGDSLGPLVGSKLTERLSTLPGRGTHGSRLAVYGTLDEPVHAANLTEWVGSVTLKHPGAAIIAVDACLGKNDNVGSISIRTGPLKPGTGVNKSLPSVGNVHLIGVVNVGGFMEYLVLQNTRLSLVMRMARAIAEGIWSFAADAVGIAVDEPSWPWFEHSALPVVSSDADKKGSPFERREAGATKIAAGTDCASSTARKE